MGIIIVKGINTLVNAGLAFLDELSSAFESTDLSFDTGASEAAYDRNKI